MRLLVILFFSLSFYANLTNISEGFSILSAELEKNEINFSSKTSCFKTSCFLISRLAKQTSMLDVSDALEKHKEKYKTLTMSQRITSQNVKELEKYLLSESSTKFLGIVFQVAGTNDHFFLGEKEGEYITVIQSFQNTYTAHKSIEQPKSFRVSEFIGLLNRLTSVDIEQINHLLMIYFVINLLQRTNVKILNYISQEKVAVLLTVGRCMKQKLIISLLTIKH